jgi:MFS family permease
MTQRSSFTYFLLIIGLNGVLGSLIGFFLPAYFKGLGFSGLQTGFYFAVSTIAIMIMSLPMGISTDRLRIGWILAFSFLLMGLSKAGFLISDSFLVFCIFSFLGSFGGRFYGTATNTMFYKITGAKDNKNEVGIYQFVMFGTMAAGMMAGGLVIADFSFRHVFVLSVVGSGVLMVLSLFLPRNETAVIAVEEYKKAVLNKRVLVLTGIFVLSSLHWGAENVSYGPFLQQVLGLSIKQTALYTSLGFVFVGGGTWLAVPLIRKRIIKDLQSLLAIGFLMGGAFHVLMTVHNVYLSFTFRALHELGDGFVFLVYYHGITKVFKIDKIGGCQAFMSLCTAIGSCISSVLCGIISDAWGPQWPLIISGCIMAAVPLLLRTLDLKALQDEPQAEDVAGSVVSQPALAVSPAESIRDPREHAQAATSMPPDH